jgi:hypothetical protein
MTRLERYTAERQHYARLAELHALAVLDGNLDALPAMRDYGHTRDTYDRQIDWINRGTATAWPATPAWCD